jgi:membrane-bound lytic murein transglycosylase C
MKKLVVTILLSLCFVAVNAQVESEFEKFKREQQEQMKAMMQSDSALYKELEKEYQDYVKAEKEAYEKFVKEISAMWGGDNVVESTNKEWVEYSDDGQSRSVVDFEQGEAKIEIIITPEEESSEVKLEAKVEEKVKDLIVNKGKTKDYDSSKEKAVPLQETPVLENQVQTPSGEVITENNVNEGVKEIVQEAVIEKKEITGDDGEKRQVVTIKLDLAPNHIKTRAEVYKNEVEKYCLKYDVDPALAYAVMQTESSFNPKAKSHVPAYGLMQIVPSSAGQDCAASLKKDFVKPTANYLYEPENNIEMGVHYLHLLKKRYYTKVTDPRSRDLCIIASYNTGAGNVARALRGDTKISKAIPQINEMSYEELFKYFEKKLLPETQNYIRKVTERMNEFNKWMK